MAVPISQMWTVASYVIKKRLSGQKRYPLVLMLEPLFRCNLACAGCGQVLAPSDGNYRMGAAELDIDMTAISPLFVAPHRETGEDLVLRRCLCPGCGNLLDTYVCRPDELPFADVTVGKPRD